MGSCKKWSHAKTACGGRMGSVSGDGLPQNWIIALSHGGYNI
jgi:hypothetical protein